LSVDPGATTVEAAKWLAYAVAFSLAAGFGRRRGARVVIGSVFFCALAVALATLGHGLVGATRVFGVYEPQLGTAAERVGPMLNPNTLAGYLILGAFCGFGFVLSSSDALWRWLWGAGTAIIVGSAILSGSRAGVAALTLGVVVLAAYALLTRTQRSKARRFRWYDWCGAGSALVAAGLFAILGTRDSWFDLTHGDLSKLRMSAWVIPMLRDFPLFGVGRGAFESAFPFYKEVSDNIIYANPENIVAQWLSEWGILVGGLGIASLLWLLRPSRIGFGRQPLASAAAIGVAALLVQNLADFSLELFAPMLATVLVLGACWGQHEPRVTVGDRSNAPWPTPLAAGLVALTLLCVGLAANRGSHPVSLERRSLQLRYAQLNAKHAADSQAMWSDIRAAIQRHPAEPYFPRLAAALALRLGNVEPLPWIGRSLERGPVDSRTHWLLARALQTRGFLQQALLEARLAVEYDKDLAATVGAAVAHWSPDASDIRKAAPRGPAGAQVQLSAAHALDPKHHTRVRQDLYLGAIRDDPSFAAAHRALAEELLYGLQSNRYESEERARCEARIVLAAKRLASLKPESADSSEVLGKLYTLNKQIDEADRWLSPRCPQLAKGERVKCWRALLATASSQPGHRQLIDRVSQQLVRAACGFEQDCQSALMQAGDAMVALGNWPEALDYFQRAAREDPSVASLLKVSEAATALGRLPVADRALALAAARARANPGLRAQIEAKRQSLLQNPPRPTGSPAAL
jgi:tetratricopeptide (TPR) repeat protein